MGTVITALVHTHARRARRHCKWCCYRQSSSHLTSTPHSTSPFIMSDDPMADFLAREKAALGEGPP